MSTLKSKLSQRVKKENPSIMMITSNYWEGISYQRHHLAKQFCKAGIKVFFVEKTPHKIPSIKTLVDYFKKSQLIKKNKKIKKNNLTIISPILLPPITILNKLNKLLIKYYFKGLENKVDVIITYVPTLNSIEIINYITPLLKAYICVHNYDTMPKLSNIHKTETILINSCDHLYADSENNKKRLNRKLNKKKTIHFSYPGVDHKRFNSIAKKNSTYKNIYFFGIIHSLLNFTLYNKLSEKYSITFIGTITDYKIKKYISKNIKIIPAVSNQELPSLLSDAHLFGLFYNKNKYVNHVLPAKIFECFSTTKPILYHGLEELKKYEDIIYNINGSYKDTIRIISNLPLTETIEKRKKRESLGINASWENRAKSIINNLTLK
ncbi:hypothetical protein DID76_02400 [Candidatus Marinamargulisbacteria bacterium SCGC AG-414-C22]|nr:hypothetical protein DID76_02400 [Candidatus Marinamargulisbacteria bacterium SCGC AG-414-C22]